MKELAVQFVEGLSGLEQFHKRQNAQLYKTGN